MSTKRTAIPRPGRPRMTPELRVKAERLLDLVGDYSEAARHEELVALAPEVHRALGIKPWHDERAMLRKALGLEPDE